MRPGKPNLNHWINKTWAGLVLVGALVCASPARVRADNPTPQKSNSAAKPQSQTTTPHHSQTASTRAGQRRSTHHPTTRRLSARAKRAAAARRRAQMRPEPERIQEIQQALVQAGYLNAQPNGRWDDQTREAMRRYQVDHGFPATGLPEAKSLMKLGLGPHPLPPELDPGSGAKAGADPNPNAPAKSPAPATPEAQQTPP